MRPRSGTHRRFLDLGVFALAVGGAIGVWKLASYNRELRAALTVADSRAVEASVRDRLVGARVPLSFLALDEPDPGDAHLIWVVDLERCPSCLAGANPAWNALGEDASLRRHLVVFEEDGVPEAARRVLRGATVMSASREELDAAFGSLLPSTKLLVGGDGIVLLADSRGAPSECDWSFEAQVGALRGTLASGVIRGQRRQP